MQADDVSDRQPKEKKSLGTYLLLTWRSWPRFQSGANDIRVDMWPTGGAGGGLSMPAAMKIALMPTELGVANHDSKLMDERVQQTTQLPANSKRKPGCPKTRIGWGRGGCDVHQKRPLGLGFEYLSRWCHVRFSHKVKCRHSRWCGDCGAQCFFCAHLSAPDLCAEVFNGILLTRRVQHLPLCWEIYKNHTNSLTLLTLSHTHTYTRV